MYARVSTFRCDPYQQDAMLSKLEEMKGQFKSLAGVVDIYSAWRSDGHGVAVAIYESQDAAQANSEKIQAIWEELGRFLTAEPKAETYDNVTHLTG
jgi:hypothetical protein